MSAVSTSMSLLLLLLLVSPFTSAFVVRPASVSTTASSVSWSAHSQKQSFQYSQKSCLFLSETPKDEQSVNNKSKLPFFLDPGTKGGALFLSLVLFLIPLGVYNVLVSGFGYDEIDTGKWIGVGFTVFSILAWVSTYLFRVATKDMTYAKQLKDYENAVIAKRMEELDEDELQALVEEIQRDDF